MYEILRLQATNRSDSEQYRQYRLAVKNRVNGPYQVTSLHSLVVVNGIHSHANRLDISASRGIFHNLQHNG